MGGCPGVLTSNGHHSSSHILCPNTRTLLFFLVSMAEEHFYLTEKLPHLRWVACQGLFSLRLGTMWACSSWPPQACSIVWAGSQIQMAFGTVKVRIFRFRFFLAVGHTPLLSSALPSALQ